MPIWRYGEPPSYGWVSACRLGRLLVASQPGRAIVYVNECKATCTNMNGWFAALYFLFFAVIAGGAFAMMWGNIRNTSWDKPAKRHPEAPQPGEEVLYANFSREKLEELYQK